jgi:hypothetical protein
MNRFWIFVLTRLLGGRPVHDKYTPRLVRILRGMIVEMSPGFARLISENGHETLVEEALSRAASQESDNVPRVGQAVSELLNIVDQLHKAETNNENIRDVRIRQIVDFSSLR